MSDNLSLAILFSFFFFGLTGFSLLINSILLRFVKTLGTKNQPGAVVRWSAETKPAIGGLAFFIVFLISFWIYSIAFDSTEVFKNGRVLGLLVAGTLGFLMGLTDDAYNTRPILKFAVQILCGVILTLSGTSIELFESSTLNAALTIIWVVGIMNSINMLDNMDGISTSISAFIVAGSLGFLAIRGDWLNVDFILLLGILSALVGFLFYNWNPSSMYMGDTGSQFLGVILAYVGIEYCWNVHSIGEFSTPWAGVVSLITLFILPFSDTVTVVINRIRDGQSPFVGGKDHTTHNLSYLGNSDRTVAGIFCLAGLLSTTLYLITIFASADYKALLIGISLGFSLVVFSVLFGITVYNRKRNHHPKKSEAKNAQLAN
jgi:UDP-GlcNAc:undecaprenyl-phosphate GlcNAc-1-phosphate transferase